MGCGSCFFWMVRIRCLRWRCDCDSMRMRASSGGSVVILTRDDGWICFMILSSICSCVRFSSDFLNCILFVYTCDGKQDQKSQSTSQADVVTKNHEPRCMIHPHKSVKSITITRKKRGVPFGT